MASAAERGGPELSRVHLVAALLDLDNPDLKGGFHDANSAAQRSAVLKPFAHLLQPPPPLEQFREDARAPEAPAELITEPSSAVTGRTSSWEGSDRLALGMAAMSMQEDLYPAEEEERLADEWGLGSHLRQLGSVPTSPVDPLRTLPLPFPTNPSNEADEVNETRSMPDLDRPRALSGAAELDRSATTGGNDLDQPRRRIRILERRGSAARLRTQSLGDALELPSFGDLPSFDDGATPRASMDPLVNPGARMSTYSNQRQSVFSLADQTSADEPRSSFARPRTSMSTHTRPISHYSMEPAFDPRMADAAEEEHPFDDTRPLSSLSMNPVASTPFTSRFDPAMLAIAKEEIAKERPIFANKNAGAPPSIVLMPAPLAGRPASPPRRVQKEGPDSVESEPDEQEEGELLTESETGSQRPAGALYGRSLMDVMEERRNLMKGRARHYVAGNDGRRSMMDWGDSPAGQKLLAAQGITAEGGAEENTGGKLVAGKRNKSAMSVFGPDVFYQRDLERMRILEAEEAREREEEEAREALVWEKERLKEEKKRSGKGKLLKADRRKSVEMEKMAAGAGRSPPTSPGADGGRGHVAAAPSLSLPAFDLAASTSTSWLPAELQRAPSSAGSSASGDRYRPPPVPERIPLHATSFAQKYGTTQQKSSAEHAAALRSAVMMGTMSAEEAAAESHRLGLGSGSGSYSTESDTRPLGERLTRDDPSSQAPYTSAAPPQLRVSLDRGGWDPAHYERDRMNDLNGEDEPATPPAAAEEEEDDGDDVPLAFRASMLNSQRPGAAPDDDDDDLPLGVRASMLSFQQDEDDRPLAFNAAHQQQQQQYQVEQHYLNQQRQAEIALFQAHQFNMSMQQAQFGAQYGYGAEAGGSAVERWRRGVEG